MADDGLTLYVWVPEPEGGVSLQWRGELVSSADPFFFLSRYGGGWKPVGRIERERPRAEEAADAARQRYDVPVRIVYGAPPLSPEDRARIATDHADQLLEDASWDDIADAYLVAGDAWLEARDPEEAAHQLLQAAEYRRWAIDERESVVPGGIERSAIGSQGPKAGRVASYLPILRLREAANIARLAGWLETVGSRSARPELAALQRFDRHGRPQNSRIEWLLRMTILPVAWPGLLLERRVREGREVGNEDLLRFRKLLLEEERRLARASRDPTSFTCTPARRRSLR